MEISRQHCSGWLEEGRQHHQSGNLEQAAQLYRKVLEIDPENTQALHVFGRLCGQKGDYKQAGLLLEQAISLKPNCAEAYSDLGNVCRLQGRYQDAEDCYRNAALLKPDYAPAYHNLGLLLAQQGRLDEAISCFEWVLDRCPGQPEALENLVLALVERARYFEAIETLLSEINRRPRAADLHAYLGLVYRSGGYLDEAVSSYRRAVMLEPHDYRKHHGLGVALREDGRWDEALRCFDTALGINPHDPLARWHRSLVLLAKGDFQRGWADFEARLLSREPPSRTFGAPRWDGTALVGRTLLVHAEQGIGDEIMFASCIPDLLGQGGQCVIECASRLAPLFARSFPSAIIHGGDQDDNECWLSEAPKIDIQVPIGSLPLRLRKNLGEFPKRRSYLCADPKRTEYWSKVIGALGPGPKIGISWRGGRRNEDRVKRSVVLKDWYVLFTVPGLHFINLQYGADESELREVETQWNIKIHRWEEIDPLNELDNFAALISALDLVISVDNATVHLSCSLGVPSWILVPYAPEWRWMLGREDSPWYPSARLFRQRRRGDWQSVLQNVKKALLR